MSFKSLGIFMLLHRRTPQEPMHDPAILPEPATVWYHGKQPTPTHAVNADMLRGLAGVVWKAHSSCNIGKNGLSEYMDERFSKSSIATSYELMKMSGCLNVCT